MKTKNKISLNVMVLLSLVVISTSCKKSSVKEPVDNATSGNVYISVDESFKLMIDAEIYTFEALYRSAHVNPLYKPDVDVINDFLGDSIRTIITTRKLTKEDEDYFRSKQIVARTTVIAHDALALIVNEKNKDTLMECYTVKDIFTNKINSWDQVNPKNKLGKIKIVFDNEKSGNVLYFKEKYKLDTILPENFMAAHSNEEVISYIENNPNAIGILSVNWISDKNDTVSQSFLSRINVVGVSSEDAPGSGSYYKPYQAYIADESYPFIRDVYMICRESYTGLGSGFTQFVAGEKGQRIILKSKLVPATMPLRIVELK